MENQEGVEEPFLADKIHVCKWDTDPRFYGSFSNRKVKAFKNQNGGLKRLNAALEAPNSEGLATKRVYFAGEAHSSKYSGYLQGAYFSGEATATELIQDFKD